ncbi:adenine deaminase [Pararhizobium mangrovi]|uniref:Adenine deaminase n=1 Tax=Pararhizobium mangrovi TaxID=2590452 RepID=A0A506UBF3_9HYPH|nr:adenine deaminase [Pararhizobium mangrovi]TPW31270.1 adenine deaminase [Pararhizobium mangrovi]
MTDSLAKRIEQGSGAAKADLVLKGGRVFDLVTGDLVESDVAICGETIVGTYETYDATREIDVAGKVIVPGFIDTHLHVESSLLTPHEFDRCVLPRGITTAICDPHEIANVLGAEGIRYFLAAADETIMDLRVQLSSCVPATDLETSGAALSIDDLLPFRDHAKVIGLAEFMNFPGVLARDPGCMAKLEAFRGGHIDGHAPLLRGHGLNGYLAAGIRTEHEATSADEALEKLRKGVRVLVREGSVSKDLDALLPIITERHSPFLALCTDDRNPLDIAEHGHLDYMIRHAIENGVEPLAIYRAATISGARAFGLMDRGLVAPGWRADLVVLDSLEGCNAEMVFSAGRRVTDALFDTRRPVPVVGRASVRVPVLEADAFVARPSRGETSVIGILPGKIITEHRRHRLPEAGGEALPDPQADIVRLSVVERHGKNGNVANAFVQGFGLARGAIACSIGHDSHNIGVVGLDRAEMAVAVNRLRDLEGGIVVVDGGKVAAEIALPIAGLMSEEPHASVRARLERLREAAHSLGVTLDEPFLQLAFLPLPVIPHLKLSDRGLVDVDRFALVEPAALH